MEIMIALFQGIWISGAGLLAYWWLRKEFLPWTEKKQNTEEEDIHE